MCHLWKEVSERPTLWEIVDIAKGMSAGWKCPSSKSGFTGLVRRRLAACKVLNLANCNTVMSHTWAVQVIGVMNSSSYSLHSLLPHHCHCRMMFRCSTST